MGIVRRISVVKLADGTYTVTLNVFLEGIYELGGPAREHSSVEPEHGLNIVSQKPYPG